MKLKDRIIKLLGGYTKQEYDDRRTIQEKEFRFIKTELEPIKCKIVQHHSRDYLENETPQVREQRLWDLLHYHVVDFILENKLFTYSTEMDWHFGDTCEVLEINFLKERV